MTRGRHCFADQWPVACDRSPTGDGDYCPTHATGPKCQAAIHMRGRSIAWYRCSFNARAGDVLCRTHRNAKTREDARRAAWRDRTRRTRPQP